MTRLVASLVVACLAFAGGLTPNPASAYPTRPVTLVLGFAPGGPSDVMARIFSRKLEQLLGQPVVIENRSGAGGNIAGESVARAAPDGYTILLANSGILAANAQLYKRTGFDAERDFAPITRVGAQANVLVINPSIPAKTLGELIAYAKANPGKVSFASGGHGSSPHLAGELLKAEAKINLVHVPYKGTGPALRDVVAGHVQMMFSAVSPSKPLMESGKVRGLAVTTLKRTALLPDVPSVAEVAIPGFEATAWHALVAPAKTPPEALATLHKAMTATLKDPEVSTALTKLGLDIMPTTPAELAAYIKAEIPKWAKIIQASGAKMQ
jgi:tripartite-type tricarboxylate transporter receptor subunit TctC